jgi:D-alanine-D-alanine ligase
MDTIQIDNKDLAKGPANPAVQCGPKTRLNNLETTVETAMSRMRLAVIYGGNKSIDGSVIHQTLNTRSWKSYEAVARDIADSLKSSGFKNVILLADDMGLPDRLQKEKIDMAWLNSGGTQGYNPMCHAPAMLEMLGIPYIGHDPLTMSTLDNKHAFKRDLSCLGIPTAPFMTWHLARGPFRPKVNSRFIRIFQNHWGPYIVKPVSGRASLHVHVVDDEADLPDAINEVFKISQNHVLIEAYLPGQEYCVAVSGPVVQQNGQLFRSADPFIFSPCERVFEADEKIVTSMDIRPITKDRLRLVTQDESPFHFSQLQELARTVYLDFNLEFLVRLDLRANAAGELFILEANPKPDLKKPGADVTSIVCTGLEAQGLTYDDLLMSLFANRLDFLMTHRRSAVPQLVTLLKD